jgi:hypothetical protein
VSARRLRPIQTPTIIATMITARAAIRVVVSVFMVSFHNPVPRMTSSQTTVITVGRHPPSR